MSEIPEDKVTQADLSAWYEMSQELKKLRAKEMILRKKIFDGAFPDPKEGTNNYELADGYMLKGKYELTRNIDPGALDAMKATLRENNINPDALVQYKPSLVTKEFRALTEEQHKLFDQCLIIKPGSPALEIVLPKKAAK